MHCTEKMCAEPLSSSFDEAYAAVFRIVEPAPVPFLPSQTHPAVRISPFLTLFPLSSIFIFLDPCLSGESVVSDNVAPLATPPPKLNHLGVCCKLTATSRQWGVFVFLIFCWLLLIFCWGFIALLPCGGSWRFVWTLCFHWECLHCGVRFYFWQPF